MGGDKYFDQHGHDSEAGFLFTTTGTESPFARELQRHGERGQALINRLEPTKASVERLLDNRILPHLGLTGASDEDKSNLTVNQEKRRHESQQAEVEQNNDKDEMSGRIHANLVELSQWVFGRGQKEIEKDILDSLMILNSDQFASRDSAYRERYGTGIAEAISSNRHLSDTTKQAAAIYLKGADQLSHDDVLNLADIALKSGNADLFQQVFTGASREIRQKFLDAGGHTLINAAFQKKNAADNFRTGVSMSLISGKTRISQEELNHLHEIVETGAISTATQVRDNTSFFGDSEKGIELALFTMDDEDRQLYLRGQDLTLQHGSMSSSEADRKAIEHYTRLHAALMSAGNKTEVARWEDMIAVKGGSLVSKLLQHSGLVFNGSVHDVLNTVETMDEKDWHYLASRPEYRKEIEAVLAQILSKVEKGQVLSLLDKKLAATSFDSSHNAVRSALSKIDASTNTGFLWLNNNEQNIIQAIQQMSPDEQNSYRHNPELRAQLKRKVADTLDEGAERETAINLLKQIEQGISPKVDLVEQLKLIAAERHERDITETIGAIAAAPVTALQSLTFVADRYLLDGAVRNALCGTNSRDVIAIVEQAYRDDAQLQEQIKSPKTAEDSQRSAAFKEALKGALGESQFAKYGSHLIDHGHVPIELKVEFHRGVLDDGELGLCREMITVSEEERRLLLADDIADTGARALQEEVFAGFSAQERKVARNVLRQGMMNPEDNLRAYMLGTGTCEDEIKLVLGALNPANLEQVQSAYAEKYGSDLTADLLDELGGKDLTDVKRLLRRGSGGVLDDFNAARDEYYESRAGLGADLVDELWDGTGYQSDQAHRQYVKKLAEAARNFAQMSPAMQANLVDSYLRALDNFTESKGALADAAADLGITGVAIAGAYLSGGTSLALLSKLSLVGKVGVAGTLGAFLKVSTKAAIMGSDYDLSYVPMDATTGFINAGFNYVGAAEIGELLKVGEAAGKHAAEEALKLIPNALLKDGGIEALKNGLVQLMSNSIATGAKTVSAEALMKLAGTVAEPAVQQLVAEALGQVLETAITEQSKKWLANKLIEYSLTATAGFAAGSTMGTTRAVDQWDTTQSPGENLAHAAEKVAVSGLNGAGLAVAFKAGVDIVQGVVSQGRELAHAHRQPLDELAPANGDPPGDGSAHIRHDGSPDPIVTDNIHQQGAAESTVGSHAEPTRLQKYLESHYVSKQPQLAPYQKSLRGLTRDITLAPVEVTAQQVTEPVMIGTPAGKITAAPGDWLITGVDGKQFSLAPEQFDRLFAAIDGNPGVFQQRPLSAQAVPLKDTLVLPGSSGRRAGKAHDWLILTDNGEMFVVDRKVFPKVGQNERHR